MRKPKSNRGNWYCTIDIPYDYSESYGGLYSAAYWLKYKYMSLFCFNVLIQVPVEFRREK